MALDVKTQPRSNMRDREDLRNVSHAQKYILSALERCGASGNWMARATVKITWNNPNKRFQVRGLDETRKSLTIRVKPGDNGSAWEYDLCAPQNIEPVELRRLYQVMQYTKINELIPEKPCEAPKVDGQPEPQRIGKTFIPVDDGKPVLRPCNRCGKQVDVGFKNRHFEYAEASRFCDCLLPSPFVNGPENPFPNPDPRSHKSHMAEPIADLPVKAVSEDKLVGMISKIATISQRVKNRQEQKRILMEQKVGLEQDFEDLTAEMATVDAALKGIVDEEAADNEAKAAMGILALMEGRV